MNYSPCLRFSLKAPFSANKTPLMLERGFWYPCEDELGLTSLQAYYITITSVAQPDTKDVRTQEDFRGITTSNVLHGTRRGTCIVELHEKTFTKSRNINNNIVSADSLWNERKINLLNLPQNSSVLLHYHKHCIHRLAKSIRYNKLLYCQYWQYRTIDITQ